MMDVVSQPSAIATRKLNTLRGSEQEQKQLATDEGWNTKTAPAKPQTLKEKQTSTASTSTITENLSVTSADADPSLEPTQHSSTETLADEAEDQPPKDDRCDTQIKLYPKSCLKIKSHHVSAEQSFGSGKPASKQAVVRFGTITILSHKMCLGDSPSVTTGPPIQIEWTAFDTASYDLNDFEQTKPPARLRPEMQLPAAVREDILMRAGFSRPELKAAAQEARQIQKRILKSSRDADRWWSFLRRHVVVKRRGDKHTEGALISKAKAI